MLLESCLRLVFLLELLNFEKSAVYRILTSDAAPWTRVCDLIETTGRVP